jgi:hypothetical protein
VALALAAIYVAIVLPRTLAASDYHYRLTDRVRDLVEGTASAHQLHPDQTILLDGLDTPMFYSAVIDHPFRLVGVERVYLTPGSVRQIESHPELADMAAFTLPAAELAKALENESAQVYDVSRPMLRNITSSYAGEAHTGELPLQVDVGDPLAAPFLGPEWYGADSNHRWMPQRASLRLTGPSAPGAKLYLRGYYPAGEMSKGPVTVTVSVNGSTLAPAKISEGGNFELAFALPAETVGLASMPVVVQVSRTFRAGADVRDLGLAFGEFEVK